jgi:hypothetical protein
MVQAIRLAIAAVAAIAAYVPISASLCVHACASPRRA